MCFTSWGHTYVTLNQPAIAPRGEAIPPTELFRRLAARLGLDEPYLQESDESMVKMALTSDHPYLRGIDFESLRTQGWARLNLPEEWLPYANGGFPTPSGKCEFFSATLAEQRMDPLPTYQPAGESPAGNLGTRGTIPVDAANSEVGAPLLELQLCELPPPCARRAYAVFGHAPRMLSHAALPRAIPYGCIMIVGRSRLSCVSTIGCGLGSSPCRPGGGPP